MILVDFLPKFGGILLEMGIEEVGQLFGVPNEIKRLSGMVGRIQSVLVDAEQRQMEKVAIKRWVMELKDVMYDAEDIVDLYQMKAKKGRVGSRSSSSSSDANWWSGIIAGVNNILSDHHIASKIKALRCRMDDIMKDLPLLGLVENRGASSEARQVASNLSRKTHPVVVLSDLVGETIEEDADELVKLLTKDATEEQGNIAIVAIEGMGGIGKTTLAKKVFNDPRIQEDFDHLIWVCVSKEIKQVDVLKNVIREIGGDCGAAEEISELIPRLVEFIRGKKFFMVLDDIWRESEGDWYGLLRDPMTKGARGSRILITTRDGGVAMGMRAIHTHKVNRLSDDDGWSLLIKQVVPNGDRKEIHDLKDIGMQIVKKCNGLPLAIKSIGGVLCMKGQTRIEWQAVLESNMWSIDGLPGDVHRAFYLSYDDLSSPLKQCFIFCSLFPEDYLFLKSKLIYLWLAEGFLEADKRDFRELGNKYYTELLLRNLLEVTGNNYEQGKCKMHDILWSFARQLGKDENYAFLEGQALSRCESSLKVRRLTIEGNAMNTEVIKKQKGLRTLLLHFKPEIALDNLCKAFSILRILDLSCFNFSNLPDSLCDLVHLRYLDVRMSKITNLPNSIGNLKYLVYLNLENCKDLSHVPDSIMNLQELSYLNTYNSGVDGLPTGLNKLEQLIELYGFKPYQNSLKGFSTLNELKTLSKLLILNLCSLERVSIGNMAKMANLQNKDRLQKLKLLYTSLSWKDQVSQTYDKKRKTEGVLNELCPPRSIEFLHIVNYFGSYLPNWLNLGATLPNLRHLQLKNCACFQELAPLGQLPKLDLLQIKGAYSVVTVGKEFMHGNIKSRNRIVHAIPAFPKLNILEFDGMLNWKNWQWNKEQPAMPKLKKLCIRACPQLISLPEGLLLHATSLEYLEIMGADKLNTIENFPSINRIRVIRNPILKIISNLPRISYIVIKECPNLKTLENLNAIQTVALTDYKMEKLPDYLRMIMPQRLTIRCSEDLLLQIASQGQSGFQWNKFKHIPKVTSTHKANHSMLLIRRHHTVCSPLI
ncbi:putative disease resistance protein RGA3 [Carex rostrata]